VGYDECYWGQETTFNLGCAAGTVDPSTGVPNKGLTGGGVMDGNSSNSDCACFPQPFCCSGGVPIPAYQDPALMLPIIEGGNGGSTQWRNYPDVSAVSAGVEYVFQGSFGVTGGTSVAAPVWAGFAALVNQYARQHGVERLGFANPALYAIGETRGTAVDLYEGTFHDIVDGVANNVPASDGFPSVAGYDLATGWGSPRCLLLQQLGTYQPTAPQTFGTVLVHVANGHDGVDDDSSVRLDLRNVYGETITTMLLKHPGRTGWADIGAEHDLVFPLSGLSAPLSPNDIGGVTLRLTGNDDDWNVAGLEVMLAATPPTRPGCVTDADCTSNVCGVDGLCVIPIVGVPYACITDVSGRDKCNLDQPGCSGGRLTDGNFGVTRLNQSSPSASFDTYQLLVDPLARKFGGCQPWGGSVPVPSFDELYFLFDTGDDDLNDDSELRLDIFDPLGGLLEQGLLHRNGDLAFVDQTQWDVTYQLQNGSRSYAEIGSMQLTLIAGPDHGEDEWHLQAVEVYGIHSSSSWEYTCLFHGEETSNDIPEFKFDTDDGPIVHVLSKGAGCHP
jgi:hypothetical protein